MLPEEEFVARRKQLQTKIIDSKIDAYLISHPESIYYYTGATYKAQERPFLIVAWPKKNPTFLVPKLEEAHMEKANIGNVKSYWEYPSPQGEGWPEKMHEIMEGVGVLGFEPSLSIENYNKISGHKMKPINLVEKQRLVKTEREIQLIQQTAQYSDSGMQMIMQAAYYGISVLEMFSLGKKIQLDVIKTKEFDPLNCEFLTATWPAPFSAKPHGVPPLDGKLKDGPLVAMSYLRVNGYAAECERTFFLSPPSEKEKQIFEDMYAAQQKAFDMIKPGVSCAELDRVTLNYLKEKGYGEYLLHRTGHGIGLGNHEGPWVSDGSDHILEENMIISVEPGIYIPEIGGFRHSDTVLVTSSGYKLLTHFPRDIESLTILKTRPLKKMKGWIIQKAVGI